MLRLTEVQADIDPGPLAETGRPAIRLLRCRLQLSREGLDTLLRPANLKLTGLEPGSLRITVEIPIPLLGRQAAELTLRYAGLTDKALRFRLDGLRVGLFPVPINLVAGGMRVQLKGIDWIAVEETGDLRLNLHRALEPFAITPPPLREFEMGPEGVSLRASEA